MDGKRVNLSERSQGLAWPATDQRVVARVRMFQVTMTLELAKLFALFKLDMERT